MQELTGQCAPVNRYKAKFSFRHAHSATTIQREPKQEHNIPAVGVINTHGHVHDGRLYG